MNPHVRAGFYLASAIAGQTYLGYKAGIIIFIFYDGNIGTKEKLLSFKRS